MVRNAFGGTSSDFVFSSYTLGSSKLLALAAATLTFFDAETGGNPITDLSLDAAGTQPVTQIGVPNTGDVPTFYGPSGVTEMWAAANGGPRVKLASVSAAAAAVTGAQAAQTAAEAAQTAAANSATAAAASASQATAPTDSMVASLVPTSSGSATSAQLSAAFATAIPDYGRVVATSLVGSAYPVNGDETVGLLALDVCTRSSVIVETQVGGVWTQQTLQSVGTGSQTDIACAPGRYRFDLTGATQVRGTATLQPGVGTVIGRIWAGRTLPTTRPHYSPSASPQVSSLDMSEAGYQPHPTLANVIYSYVGSLARKSTNGGTTWTTIFTGPAPTQRVARLDSGRIIAFFNNGTVYLSDTNEANFALVHTAETPGVCNSASFGFDANGSTVVYAEYGPNNAADQARRAYQSDDGGLTWRKIFEGPQNGTSGNTYHTHDVRYDPYEDIVWVVNGDGIANANIQYRPRTATGTGGWTKLWVPGDAPLQWTTVIPLPSCVLFLSDNFHQSTWRYDRRTQGLTRSAPRLELAQSISLNWNPEPISTNPLILRPAGGVHVAYFAWTVNSSNSKVVTLWGTADGITFHPVWSSPRAPLNEGQADIFVGIFGAAGIDTSGQILIDYRDRTLGSATSGHLVKITAPTWQEQAA